jgi:hypothetical protein
MTKAAAARPAVNFRINCSFPVSFTHRQRCAPGDVPKTLKCAVKYAAGFIRFATPCILRHQYRKQQRHGHRVDAQRRFRMSESGGFRAHHKYMIAAVGVIAVLAFLYNLGVFDIWSTEQLAK